MNPTHLSFALDLAKTAGDIMRQHFTIGLAAEYKSDNSPITVADTQINEMVAEKIKQTYPDHSYIGEEGGFTVEGSTFTWVCDPIDGTMPYAAGIPISMFCLALVEDGKPILGVMYDPFSDRMLRAELGGGAFMNDAPIHTSDRYLLERAIISNEASKFQVLTPQFHAAKVKTTRFYCTSCVGAQVAMGQFDAVLFGAAAPWDIAAIKVIVEEAGGTVTDVMGNEQRYDQPINGAIISNGPLHSALVQMAMTVA